MTKNIRNTYKNSTVRLDDNEFVECTFDHCRLIYSGTTPVSLVGCHLINVGWEFDGPANNTIQFLRGVYHGMGEGGRELVERTFDDIRKPR